MNILKQKMIDLVDFLNYHQDLYDKGTPIISDSKWDEAYFELKELEEALGESLPNSPAQKIRYEVVTELKKVKHEYQPMLSLDKTKDIEEVKRFAGDKEWIAMLKLDGLSLRLTYENGKLISAVTRGQDGSEGDDVTHNARVIPSIPKKINNTEKLIIDGEIICSWTDFSKVIGDFTHPRNLASGSIRLLDSKECEKRLLTFVAWDFIKGFDIECDLTLNCKLTRLIDYGFYIVPFVTNHVASVEDAIEQLKEGNDTYDNYPIDGIVFKWNNNNEYNAAGSTSHHPLGGLAYKFYDEEYETELLDIEYTMGKTGVLTPTAVYKEIEIDGSKCSRASLHNINTMKTLLDTPFMGQKIWVYKSNMIIPQINRSEIPVLVDTEKLIPIPEICPLCLGETEIRESDSGTLELYCTNEFCSGKLINQLEHFCSKKGLDIKGLSKATLEKLIDWGWVTRAMDLFYLHQRRREWIAKQGFGEKSVDKILDAIESARHTTLEKYLSAISIPLIGKTYAQKLAKEFCQYDLFRNCASTHFDFTMIDGIGPEKAEAIWSFDYTEADMMVDRHIIDFIQEEDVLNNSTNSLEGLIFCITGKLQHHKNRDELKVKIEAVGGKVSTSVSSKTSYLVNNDINSTSSKNKTAKELNIPIITEEELLGMLN